MTGFYINISIVVATIERPKHPPPITSAVHIFAAQPSEVWHLLWQSLSDGVRPSITLVSHALTLKDIEICSVPYDRGTFLLSGDQILQYWKTVSIFCLRVYVGLPRRTHTR